MKTRHAEDISTLGDFLSLLKKGEKGRFFCSTCRSCYAELGNKRHCRCGGERCGTDFTSRLKSFPNDDKLRTFRCSGCGRMKVVNAAILEFIAIRRAQAEGKV